MKTKLLFIAALLLVAFMVGWAVMVRMGNSDPASDLSDLVLERPELLPEDNAYTVFAGLTNVFNTRSESSAVLAFLDGNAAASNAALEVITRNESVLTLINQGIARQRCLAPEIISYDAPLTYVSQWREIGKYLAAKTRHDRLSGCYASAVDVCTSHLRFAYLIQDDAESIIGYLVGLSVLDMALTQARDLARDAETPVADLSRLSDALSGIGSLSDGLVRAIKMENKITSNIINSFGDGKLTLGDISGIAGGGTSSVFKGTKIPRYLFKPNTTKAAFAEVYRSAITNAPLSYADMSFYDVESMVGVGQNKFKMMLSPNAVGRILAAIMVPALDGMLERRCRLECELVATRLLLAVQTFKKDTGLRPATLHDLVPKYIDAIPVDAFDGQPFRYNAEKGVLYSVGEDGKDSGGIPVAVPRDRWDAEDGVFEIEVDAAVTE